MTYTAEPSERSTIDINFNAFDGLSTHESK